MIMLIILIFIIIRATIRGKGCVIEFCGLQTMLFNSHSSLSYNSFSPLFFMPSILIAYHCIMSLVPNFRKPHLGYDKCSVFSLPQNKCYCLASWSFEEKRLPERNTRSFKPFITILTREKTCLFPLLPTCIYLVRRRENALRRWKPRMI